MEASCILRIDTVNYLTGCNQNYLLIPLLFLLNYSHPNVSKPTEGFNISTFKNQLLLHNYQYQNHRLKLITLINWKI
jgi:hypothetical protein